MLIAGRWSQNREFPDGRHFVKGFTMSPPCDGLCYVSRVKGRGVTRVAGSMGCYVTSNWDVTVNFSLRAFDERTLKVKRSYLIPKESLCYMETRSLDSNGEYRALGRRSPLLHPVMSLLDSAGRGSAQAQKRVRLVRCVGGAKNELSSAQAVVGRRGPRHR
jgi:hypothetical protein